jgi:hypothetical protein
VSKPQVLTCVDDAAHIMQVCQRQQELPGYFFYQGHWNPQPREEAPISLYIGAHGLEDQTDVFTVRALVFKLVEERKDVVGPRMRSGLGLNLPQNIQFKRVLLLPITIGGEDFERNVPSRPALRQWT